MIDEKGIKELVFYWIDYWHEDTINLSYHSPDHFVVKIIQKLAEQDKDSTIKAILLHTKEYESWFFTFISLIIDNKEELPEIPKESRGKFNVLRDIFIKWGKEKGYI